MTFFATSNFAGEPLLHLHDRAARPPSHSLGSTTCSGSNLLQSTSFTIYSKLGIEIVYLYFQLPQLMVLIVPHQPSTG